MLGSFTAALSLYIIFASYITAPSIETARFFGEYFIETESFNIWSAMGVEAIGTFLLMFGIYLILKINIKQSKFVHPILIGFLLSILIFFLAPYTQAGFNPARDFMPRLLSYFSGWDMAFSANGIGWLTVYIVSPIVGSVSAALLYIRLLGKGR